MGKTLTAMLVLGGAVVLAGCACISDGGGGGLGLGRGELVKSKSEVNTVKMAKAPITADGVLDEAPWRSAVAMTGFMRRSDVAKIQTRLLVTYDKENLYLAVVCEEPLTDQLVTKATQRDEDQVWKDDCVEVYVDPSNEKQGLRGYYGFFVTPKNMAYDRTQSAGWSSDAWKHGARVMAGKGWAAEIAVPFTVMGVTPKPGHKLGVMVARSRKPGGGAYTTLAPCSDEAKDTTKYPVLELK